MLQDLTSFPIFFLNRQFQVTDIAKLRVFTKTIS